MPGFPDDVMLNKAAIIRRCVVRMLEEYAANPELDNYTNVDALTLNIERACQASIDMAMHMTASNKLGVPQSSAEAFLLLAENRYISAQTARSMVAMTGFRNIAIHEYQRMDMDILKAVVQEHYRVFYDFCEELGFTIQRNPND